MNYLEELCKLLRIEIMKPFRIEESDAWYRLNEYGELFWNPDGDKKSWYKDMTLLSQILTGELIIEWNPVLEGLFWYPDYKQAIGAEYKYWNNSKLDNLIKDRVGVYRTKKDAQNKAKELGWL